MVVGHGFGPLLDGAHHPHRELAADGVEAQHVACGPARAPTDGGQGEVRFAGGRVNGSHVADKYSDEAVIRFDYYLHGKDLMFAYGVETKLKTEYRLYFYKDQIIKVLIDKKGKKRLIHDQFYVKFDSTFYDENLIYYLDLENFFRITVAELFKKTPRTKSDGYIFITDISYKNNKSITYHTGNGYGSDGVMISLDTKAYTAKLAKNVKVKDYTESPDEYKALTLESLFREYSGYYIPAGITVKNGQVVEIELPYQP